MPNATFFVQECPTCGRKLEVLVEYLVRSLACKHCGGRFLAQYGTSTAAGQSLLNRADALLREVSKNRGLSSPTSVQASDRHLT